MSFSNCLIGGSGRSGSTILKKILQQHSEIFALPYELQITVCPDGLIDFFCSIESCWSPQLFDSKISRLKSVLKSIGEKPNLMSNIIDGLLRSSGISKKMNMKSVPRYNEYSLLQYCENYQNLVDKFIDELTDFKYSGWFIGHNTFHRESIHFSESQTSQKIVRIIRKFYTGVIESMMGDHGVKWYVDDTPWNLLFFEKFLQILPNSKLIHIYRDPRDVIASYIHKNWSPSNPVQAIMYYKSCMQYWWRIREKLNKNSYLEFDFESLVNDTERTLKNLCLFLDLQWNDNLLDIDLSKGNIGRWKQDFDKKNRKILCNNLEYELEQLGYDL